MGLGKTVMLISLHLHRRLVPDRGTGPCLCPASLLGKLGNGDPALRPDREGSALPRPELDQITSGFVLTTYGTMRLDAELFEAVPWGFWSPTGQHVKNPRSAGARRSRTIRPLPGCPDRHTGGEQPLELWSDPGLDPLLACSAASVRSARSGPTRSRSRSIAHPSPIAPGPRRSCSGGGSQIRNIAPELPPKTITDQPVELSPEQISSAKLWSARTCQQIRTAGEIKPRSLVLRSCSPR